MTERVTRHVTLTRDEAERLRQRARERNISEEALIHEVVRQALSERPSQPAGQQRTEARHEWQEVLALMHARAGLPLLPEEHPKGRGWTREEIYDERFDRSSR
jgi:hypothetical protein